MQQHTAFSKTLTVCGPLRESGGLHTEHGSVGVQGKIRFNICLGSPLYRGFDGGN